MTAMTETQMCDALRARYGQQAGNGARYAVAAGVRSHAGFDAKRTADFIAMDLWPSSGLLLHGHEVKVSRSDWLRELKDPSKADEFIPYVNHWWLVVPDAAIVRDGELPDGWGLLAMRGDALKAVRKAAWREALPLPATRLAALLRAVAQDAGNHARLEAEKAQEQAGGSVDGLRRQVRYYQDSANAAGGRLQGAEKAARAWQAAYAAAGGLPCAHCGKPVKPAKVRTSFLYDWRHVKAADERECSGRRTAAGRWDEVEPATEIEPPAVPSTVPAQGAAPTETEINRGN